MYIDGETEILVFVPKMGEAGVKQVLLFAVCETIVNDGNVAL